MKLLHITILSTILLASIGCEDAEVPGDTTVESPLIGSWTHNTSIGHLEVVSTIPQQTSAYGHETIGAIEVTGAHTVTLNHFFRAVPIMGGCPYYSMSDRPFWDSPNASISLFDTCEWLEGSTNFKSLSFSYGQGHFSADSVEFFYDKQTGVLTLPRTVLKNSILDSVIVEGVLTVRMIDLNPMDTIQVLEMDIEDQFDPPNEYRFISNDSVLFVADTVSNEIEVLPWTQLNDSISITKDEIQITYDFSIISDTLILTTGRSPDNGLQLLEAWGDLEMNSLSNAWWTIESVYLRAN